MPTGERSPQSKPDQPAGPGPSESRSSETASTERGGPAGGPTLLRGATLSQLQRSIGNRAVGGLLSRAGAARTAPVPATQPMPARMPVQRAQEDPQPAAPPEQTQPAAPPTSAEGAPAQDQAQLVELRQPVTIGPERHTLFVEERDGRLELMIASQVKLFSSFMSELKEKQAYKSLQGTSAAKASLDAIEPLMERYKQISGGWKKGLGAVLGANLSAIASDLKSVHNVDRPPTVVTWGASHTISTGEWGATERGTSMKAEPLSIDPGGNTGSEPGTPYKQNSYVKGHLLNHHLHGPAVDKNLVPMTNALNQAFERQVESYVKQAVLSKNMVVSFEVKTSGDTDFDPEKIEFTAQEMKLGDGGWELKTDGSPFMIKGELDQAGDGSITQHIAPINADTGKVPRGPSNIKVLSEYKPAPMTNLDQSIAGKAAKHDQLSNEWSLEFGQELKSLLGTISTHLEQAAVADTSLDLQPIPKSNVTFGPTRKVALADNRSHYQEYEAGTSMEAKLLSVKPGNTVGYEPPESGKIPNFVQGHMLNHHLHGPGEPRNFLPMTQSANQKFEGDVESLAKSYVLLQNRVVSFKVSGENWETRDEYPAKVWDDSQFPTGTPEHALIAFIKRKQIEDPANFDDDFPVSEDAVQAHADTIENLHHTVTYDVTTYGQLKEFAEQKVLAEYYEDPDTVDAEMPTSVKARLDVLEYKGSNLPVDDPGSWQVDSDFDGFDGSIPNAEEDEFDKKSKKKRRTNKWT